MTDLLDVNVLLALFDRDHVDHGIAQEFVSTRLEDGWASCPITQNGFVRIISQPRYPSPVSTADALVRLSEATSHDSHVFWADDASLTDPGVLLAQELLGPRQVTDAYLLALAVRHDGRLVTFDSSVPLRAVVGAGPRHLEVRTTP